MHWILHFIGADNLSGPAYGFWSGFGSDLSEIALIGALVPVIRKHNCHVKGCWRVGRHPVAGTSFIVCRKHHPNDSPTHQDVLDAHEAATVKVVVKPSLRTRAAKSTAAGGDAHAAKSLLRKCEPAGRWAGKGSQHSVSAAVAAGGRVRKQTGPWTGLPPAIPPIRQFRKQGLNENLVAFQCPVDENRLRPADRDLGDPAEGARP